MKSVLGCVRYFLFEIMPHLFLLRHAPTIANAGGRFMGRMDVPCSEEGLLAIETAKKGLSLVPDIVLCSPLLRAATTARKLFPEQTVQVEENLTERGLGEWSGALKDDVRERYPEAFLPSGKIDPLYCPPRGESWNDFRARGERFLASVDFYPQNTTVVAVTHNGMIRLLRHLVSQLPAEQIFASDEHFLQPIELPLEDFKKTALKRAV